MLFPDHCWQHASNDGSWQRASKYKSSVHNPPQTIIFQLATHLKLQTALQITVPTALPTRNWNKDREGNVGGGETFKQSEGGKTT